MTHHICKSYQINTSNRVSEAKSAILNAVFIFHLTVKRSVYKIYFEFDQVRYLGKLDGKDLLVLLVHEETIHEQLVVDVPGSWTHKHKVFHTRGSELIYCNLRRLGTCLSTSWSR